MTGHTRTQLWTPDGYRNVEDIEVGDLVFSRSEYDPAGLIVAKPVEERFVRTGRILHLHFPGGELIRTTPEHPFYVHSRGWVAAGELAAGDWVLTEAGEWKKVSDVFDTGEYEVVYNLRVADFHTYFVGERQWGWAAWAHNLYAPMSGLKVAADIPISSTLRTAVDKFILDGGAFGDQAALTNTLKEIVTAHGAASDLSDRLKAAIDIALKSSTVQAARATFYASLPSHFRPVLETRYGGIDARALPHPGQYMTLSDGTVSTYQTHAHHIVYKKGNGSAQKRAVLEAQDVLMYYGIDPFYGQEVLVWAPNKGRGIGELENVKSELYRVHSTDHTRLAIAEVLKELGLRYIG